MPTNGRIWRWRADNGRTIVKFELLADLDTARAGEVLHFEGCDQLGAVNLRGTGFAARDVVVTTLRGKIGGDLRTVEVNVTGLPGFLLAKAAAAHSRGKTKDWYDLVFVLLHNDAGGPRAAARAVSAAFADALVGSVRTSLDELAANFGHPGAQGPLAYASQMLADHPDLDDRTLRADAVLAIDEFHRALFPARSG